MGGYKICMPTLHSCIANYLLSCLPSYLPMYLPTYLPTYLPLHPRTYLHWCAITQGVRINIRTRMHMGVVMDACFFCSVKGHERAAKGL